MVGQKIGDSDKPVSAPVHSSVSGNVTDVRPLIYSNGMEVTVVEIKPDGLQELHESVVPPSCADRESMLKAIRESGIVGLGGAGFPTSIKLSPPPGKMIDTVIINGAECEPFITSDYREMMENPQYVIEGTKKVMEITGAGKALIGIEDNKPDAIELLSSLVSDQDGIEVVSLPVRYPQGGEKQLIYALTGRKVPTGGLPMDVGVLVQNVATVSFIAQYFKTGLPLIRKKVTVDGSAVANPKNVEVLIGTPLKEVFEFCGGFCDEPRKIIMGGPMMGVAQHSLDDPVLKQTNALLAFGESDAEQPKESVCIRCGKCVAACPMSLLPLYINLNVVRGNFEGIEKYHVSDCECAELYVCPASRIPVRSQRSSEGGKEREGKSHEISL